MDIVDYRCCMCPNRGENNRICPTGPLKDKETQCRFVVTWTDAHGWKYKVMSGMGGVYKARYQKPEKTGSDGWKYMKQLEWQNTFDKAQEDLNRYAQIKGWKPLLYKIKL